MRGVRMVSSGWSSIVEKNVKIGAGTEFRRSLITSLSDGKEEDPTVLNLTSNIYVYRRAIPPKFITFPGSFNLLNSTSADAYINFR